MRGQEYSIENGCFPRLFSFWCYFNLLFNTYPITFVYSNIKPPVDITEGHVSIHRVVPWENVIRLCLFRLPDNPDTHNIFVISFAEMMLSLLRFLLTSSFTTAARFPFISGDPKTSKASPRILRSSNHLNSTDIVKVCAPVLVR